MSRPFRRAARLVVVSLSVFAVYALVASAQTMGAPERYSAIATNINNGSAGNIDITVNRWSTDKQREALIIADKEHNLITLENYDLQPVQLSHVKRERVSH